MLCVPCEHTVLVHCIDDEQATKTCFRRMTDTYGSTSDAGIATEFEILYATEKSIVDDKFCRLMPCKFRARHIFGRHEQNVSIVLVIKPENGAMETADAVVLAWRLS